jgi:hypothetical protein
MKKVFKSKWTYIIVAIVAMIVLTIYKRKKDLQAIEEMVSFILHSDEAEAVEIRTNVEAQATENNVEVEEQARNEAIQQLRKKQGKWIMFIA